MILNFQESNILKSQDLNYVATVNIKKKTKEKG